MRQLFSGRKGFILIGILGFTLILIILIIPLMTWSASEYSWTSRSFMSLQALGLADAGAEMGVWEIMHNNEQFSSWAGTNPKTKTLVSFKDNNNRNIGDISVAADQTSAHHYTITSTGYVPSEANTVASKTVKVFVLPNAIFDNAVFGDQSVTLSGITLIDSYDSSVGPYSPLSARENGDVGSNNALTMTGNASVKGDALIAPGGSASGVESRITGELFYAANPTELQPVILPSYFTALPVSPDLKLNKDTTTIFSGNYIYNSISMSSDAILVINSGTNIYINGSISITGNAQITTGSNVSIYIQGDANFAGQGITNTTGIPSNLQIYGIGSSTTINYSGGSNFYGTIYAPECDVGTSGNSNFFGAIVGGTVQLSGTGALHYDESLRENGPFNGFTIIYWQEN